VAFRGGPSPGSDANMKRQTTNRLHRSSPYQETVPTHPAGCACADTGT
jgi:hypothetical protein